MKDLIFLALSKLIIAKNIAQETVIFYILRFIHGKHTLYKIDIDNYSLTAPLSDSGISKELAVHGKRERYSYNYLKKIIKNNDHIIDIGANIGYYSIVEAMLAKTGSVYAIEPVISNLELLQKNIALNGIENITIFHLAIGDHDGADKMYIYDESNWASMTVNPFSKVRDEIVVPVMKLDTFIERHLEGTPDFIRMDVEGYEYNILRGAEICLSRKKSLRLNIEVHPHLLENEHIDELISLLQDNDFEVEMLLLEPKPHNYKSLPFLNRMQELMGKPLWGIQDANYRRLRYLLQNGYTCNVFFKKGIS